MLIEFHEPHSYVEEDGTFVWVDRYGDIYKRTDSFGMEYVMATVNCDGLFGAGYVFAPYVPAQTTEIVLVNDFAPKAGILSRYATTKVNGNLYGTIRI